MYRIARAMAVGAVKTAWDFRLDILEMGVSQAKSKFVSPRLKLHSGTNRASNFFLVRLYHRGLIPVWRRGVHAPSEKLVAPPVSGHQTVKYVIQKHDANRAGLHYDLRFMINGRGVSFAIPRARLPNEDENILAILQPDHIEEYFDFEGTIPDGNKGAGTVDIVGSGQADIVESSPDKIVFEIPDGPMSGRFVLIATQGPNWIFRAFPPTVEAAVKPNVRLYGKRAESYREKAQRACDGESIYEEKVDGACTSWSIDKEGRVELTGPRISTRTGKPIRYTNKCPVIVRDLMEAGESRRSGTGEIWHRRGPNFVAAILNSKPDRARAMQRKYGPLRLKLYDEDNEQQYKKRRDQLKDLASESGPRVTITKARIPKSGDEAAAFAEWCRTNPDTPRDGIVVKDPNGIQGEVWHKIKPSDAKDLKIVGFTEGQGKFKGSLGSIQVDHQGRTVTLGAGWTHPEGRWIWDHRNELQGDTVKASFHERSNSSNLTFTGGRFDGFHASKSEYGLMMYSETLAEAEQENAQTMLYRMKSAKGWRRA